MSKLQIELCDSIISDSISGKTIENSLMIKSRERIYYIGIETIEEILKFLKEKGVTIGL